MRNCLHSSQWRRQLVLTPVTQKKSNFESGLYFNALSNTSSYVTCNLSVINERARARRLSTFGHVQELHGLTTDTHLTQDWKSALATLQDVKVLDITYSGNLEEISTQCEQFVAEHSMTREEWDVRVHDRHRVAVDDISQLTEDHFPIRFVFRKLSLISDKAHGMVSNRALSIELLASRIHPNTNFLRDYDYTTEPPTSIGSGANGDVFLCKRKDAPLQGSARCVKRFDLHRLSSAPGLTDRLKNEAVIGLSLEHPHIARIYGVYEDVDEVSLVMQFCSGGDLLQALHSEGSFSEKRFQDIALQMLLAVNYIHGRGIVHRDIKLRNWVFESQGGSVKLIDFGLSVIDSGDLLGYCGTHGYFAPEVVYAQLDPDAAYTEKVDIWSLGVVFFELITGKPLFDQDRSRAPQDVLQEIRQVTPEVIDRLLLDVPSEARAFLKRLVMPDVAARLSAREALHDPYLASARRSIYRPKTALQPGDVLERFRHHGLSSMPSRAWSLAVARSPSQMPWESYCVLRDTFKMFESHSFTGTIDLEAFLSIVAPTGSSFLKETDARNIWRSVCGDQDSLSYGEFLAAILPPTDDAFEDVSTTIYDVDLPSDLEGVMTSTNWIPTMPTSHFLQQLPERNPPLMFNECTEVQDVLRAMIEANQRYIIVLYSDGRREFFDFMDVNNQLMSMSNRGPASLHLSDAMAELLTMEVGSVANCAGHSAFVAMSAEASLKEILMLITGQTVGAELSSKGIIRRVPLVTSTGEVFDVINSLFLLGVLMRFVPPIEALKSRLARSLDQRKTIRKVSVPHDISLLDALRIMDSEKLTVSLASSPDFAGGFGGVVTAGIISVIDLRWVVKLNELNRLDQTVDEFISWRTHVVNMDREESLRRHRFGRFNVVSVDTNASLHALAGSMLSSNLNRIFLSSEEINRIVGIVSARDILLKVLNKVLFNQES